MRARCVYMLHAYVGMWHSCQVMTLRQPLSSTTSSHEPAGHGIEMLHVRALAHESALGVSNAVCRNGGVLLIKVNGGSISIMQPRVLGAWMNLEV